MTGAKTNFPVHLLQVTTAAIVLLLWLSATAVSSQTAIFKFETGESPLSHIQNVGDKETAHQAVVEALRDRSAHSQADFVARLDELEELGKIQSYECMWIVNIIVACGDSLTLMALGDFPGVEKIIGDIPVELIAPVDSEYPGITSDGPENGIRMVRAPEAWALGLDGSGRLVCNFDTGVNGNHEALMSKYRGNNGGAPTECWFDPLTNTDYPIDCNGHGTHTMGIMLGSAGADTVGVAPGAQWIAAGVVDRGGGFQRTVADILAAFQWAAEPDGDPSTTDDVPDVVNNSWGIPIGYYPACDETFWEAIDNLEAAGVVCIFAAGNEGPYGQTVRTPADRITSDFNSFAVGAIDANDSSFHVASFSSRGPSGCDHATIKPEITAPGVMIRSAARNGGYVSLSGTSMAAPHVAGAVAILRQFNPHATPEEIKSALMNSATDLGAQGEDNDYGWGVVDIMRALQLMPGATGVVEVITPDTRAGITIYPNPFNSHTLINLFGSSNGELISIYDLTGRLLQKLELDNSSSAIWDGADCNGRPVSSGIYFARAENHQWRPVKMTLLR